jgi:hypothetical protein
LWSGLFSAVSAEAAGRRTDYNSGTAAIRETIMTDEEERRDLLAWLFDVFFGRRDATEDEKRSAVFRLGTLNRKLGKN